MNKIKYILLSLIILSNTLFAVEKLEKVSIQLHWKYQFEFAGVIAAKEKGFYKDVGLDVELKEYNFGTNIENDILKGKSNYGLFNSTILLSHINKKPIRLMASFFKRSAMVIITKPEIKTIQDLVGKKLMGINDINLRHMLKTQNIDIKNINMIEPSYNIQNFVDGKVDAMTAFISNQPYKLDKLGIKYNIIDPSDYGLYILQQELFTSLDEINNHPQRTQDFKNATIKGWKYALNHQDEVIDIIYNKYSKVISKEALKNEAKEIKKLILPHTYKIGSIDKNFLKKQIELFKKDHNITKQISLNNFICDCDIKEFKLNFTQDEKHYLSNKKELTVCVKKGWLPYESIENNKFVGISADFLNIYSKELSIPLKIVPIPKAKKGMKFLYDRKCDIKPLLGKNSKTTIPYKATQTYLEDTIALVTRMEQPFIHNVDFLSDKRLLISKGFNRFKRVLVKKHPNLKFEEVKDINTALKLVSENKAFGYIGTSLNSSFYIQKQFSSKLKIANDFETFEFGIGVVDTDPLLLNILNKVMDQVSQKEKQNIFNDWISTIVKKDTDYTLLWQLSVLFIVILIVILFFLIRQNKLKQHIEDLNKNLELRVQEEVQKNREKEKHMIEQSRLAQMGEMIAMIAHQWRQPLSAISATSGAINLKAKLNKLDNNTTIELSNKITEYSAHLSSTIDDFRNFFKPDKEKIETNYSNIIKGVLSIIQESIKNNDIELVQELNDNSIFYTYENEIKQVILNLIKNAEDILIENNIEHKKITIKSSNGILTIEDNAGGVPNDIINDIFNPYFSTKKKKDGTGLGLYMSKTIIEAHCNGKLSVSNNKDGAVFSIELKN